MSAQPAEDDDFDDLLPDDLAPASKKNAVPLVRTKRQQRASQAQAEKAQQAADLAQAQTAAQTRAATLAQIVNLHIGGYSLEAIGAAIGASADEVDRMLANETQRYVKSQPALRTYVRNYVSGKYSELLDAVWDEATDKKHPEKLDNQDRAIKILKDMARLHGAEAPTQTEVKVESAPEAIDQLVQRISAAQGMGYDMNVFDTVPGTVVHSAVEQSAAALEVSGNAVEESDGHDEL